MESYLYGMAPINLSALKIGGMVFPDFRFRIMRFDHLFTEKRALPGKDFFQLYVHGLKSKDPRQCGDLTGIPFNKRAVLPSPEGSRFVDIESLCSERTDLRRINFRFGK